eukprot:TRINITY_DN8938_c0_g1_i1.p1 TRINITY_DN8938_c0_g1~~TRINITY_DN8938_c0_g1_i1.p1  ORF type:complete len:127 (+),score=17.09 TRINITY_DN8938_c0_g1_i1:42-422(+)
MSTPTTEAKAGSSSLKNIVFSNTDVDAFSEEKTSEKKKDAQKHIHIRVQQRNGRKMLTSVQGLADDLDLKKILRALKKTFSTNGTILKDDELGEIIQIQGDQRKNVFDFLIKCNICEKDQIKVHGF